MKSDCATFFSHNMFAIELKVIVLFSFSFKACVRDIWCYFEYIERFHFGDVNLLTWMFWDINKPMAFRIHSAMTIKYKICIELALQSSAYLGMVTENFHRLQNKNLNRKL